MSNRKKVRYSSKSSRGPRRTAKKRFLIITEKSKSEASYFKKLKEELRLSENEVTVVVSSGSSPRNVVVTAKRLIERADKDEFQVVYCVFDRDTHSTYDDAIKMVSNLTQTKEHKCDSVQAITSVPCFEYWYLLHVKNTRQVFGQKDSPCSDVIDILTKFEEFKQYNKADCSNFFRKIKKHRSNAVKYARAGLMDAESTDEAKFHEDPSTRIYLVVEAIQKLAEELDRVRED